MVRPRLPPRSGPPPPALCSKTGLGRQSSSTCQHGQAFVCVLVWSLGGRGLVVTRISWEESEGTSSLGAGQEGWGQEEGKLKEDPASWASAPARESTPLPKAHPN